MVGRPQVPTGVATSKPKNLGVGGVQRGQGEVFFGWPQNGSGKPAGGSGKEVVPLASIDDFRHALECEVAGMMISNSKSEAMVLCWKMVDYQLWMAGELLPQAKVFK